MMYILYRLMYIKKCSFYNEWLIRRIVYPNAHHAVHKCEILFFYLAYTMMFNVITFSSCISRYKHLGMTIEMMKEYGFAVVVSDHFGQNFSGPKSGIQTALAAQFSSNRAATTGCAIFFVRFFPTNQFYFVISKNARLKQRINPCVLSVHLILDRSHSDQNCHWL